MLESIARLVRTSLSQRSSIRNAEESRANAQPESSSLLNEDDSAARFKLSESARATLRATGDALRRLAPRTAEAYHAGTSSFLRLLGEDGFITFSEALQAAGRTRHVGRIGEIFTYSIGGLKRIEGACDIRACAMRAVAPLYATHPLLAGTALATRAAHPEIHAQSFHAWIQHGIDAFGGDAQALELFLALKSKQARAAFAERLPGLSLTETSGTLHHYLRALTGSSFSVEESGDSSQNFESYTVRDGGKRRIVLPSRVALFDERERNFLIYKILAAQEAGRHMFGDHAADAPDLIAAYDEIRVFFSGLGEGAGGLSHIDFAAAQNTLHERILPERPTVINVFDALPLFTNPPIAQAIFHQVESGRTLRRMRRSYRGVARDIDSLTEPLLANRKTLDGTHVTSAAVEILFRLALVEGVGGDAETQYADLITSLRNIFSKHIHKENSTVADSLRATLEIYRLLPPSALARQNDSAIDAPEAYAATSEPQTSDAHVENRRSETTDALSLNEDQFGAQSNSQATEDAESQINTEELHNNLPVECEERRARYPEWDFRLNDYRMDWCRVTEHVAKGSVEAQLRQTESQIWRDLRREFERLRPRDCAWKHPLADGEELAIDAIVERRIERRRGAPPSERIYSARLRERRSVAALALLDISRSTGESIIGTTDATRVIDCARDGLLAFAVALEHIGDRVALSAFHSRGRENVSFFHLKDFEESFSQRVQARIAALQPAHNTRLGAAVRHAIECLKREAAHTKVLIILSDGLPQDNDYGDVQYAVADSACALREARAAEIKTLGVAIDAGQSDAMLEDMFGAGRFARIRDILELPIRLPRLYRHWTR